VKAGEKEGSEAWHAERLIRWRDANFDVYPDLRWLRASGNDFPSTGEGCEAMKRRGLLRGEADYFLSRARHGYHGLFIELKRQGGKLKPHQQEFLVEQKKEGYKTVVRYGWEQARDRLVWYLSGPYCA